MKYQFTRQFRKEREAFLKQYPDLPMPKPMPCLDLITSYDSIIHILSGYRRVQLLIPTDDFKDILYYEPLEAYVAQKLKEENYEFMAGYMKYLHPVIVPVRRIHYHDAAHTWYADIEVTEGGMVSATDEGRAFLHKKFYCRELDDEPEGDFFYFGLGELIETNVD